MKTISFSAFFMLICLVAYSQKNMDDVVYLKNGSKIQGTILQIIPDSVVQIRQMGGSVWLFPMKDVSLISKEEKLKFKATINEGKGYQLGFDAGFLIGSANSEYKAPFGVHMVNSYRFWPNFEAGIGTGLEFFHTTQLPLFLDTKFYLNKKFYSPYVFLQGGAMLPIGSETRSYNAITFKGKPGYMINPGIGFLFPLNEKSVFSISFSYRYQELLYESKKIELADYVRVEQMNRFNLRFGFILR